MKSKSTINKQKLALYSGMAGTFVAMTPNSDAAVIYTDIDPDETLTLPGEQYLLDIDGDGVDDFQFSINQQVNTSGSLYTKNSVSVVPLGNNQFMGSVSSWTTYLQPFALENGDTADAAQNWVGGTSPSGVGILGSQIISSGVVVFSGGNFLGATDKFIGLKFEISGQTHYGWVRLNVSEDATSITIKDYAYDDTPNQAIVIQSDDVAIGDYDVLDAAIYSHGQSIYIHINEHLKTGTECTVVSGDGKQVFSGLLNQTSQKIQIPQARAGVYVVALWHKDKRLVQKVVLQ